MMIPNCRKRLESALTTLKSAVVSSPIHSSEKKFMWADCGHFQLHTQFRSLNWIENYLIHLQLQIFPSQVSRLELRSKCYKEVKVKILNSPPRLSDCTRPPHLC